MTPAELEAGLARLFTVHEEPGYLVSYQDQNGATLGAPYRDMDLAPCGEPYITFTSFGWDTNFSSVPVLFQREGLAFEWLWDEIVAFAREAGWQAPDGPTLHLYWRDKPQFFDGVFMQASHANAVRTASPLAAISSVTLGFAQARLLLSKKNPEGSED